MKQFKIAALWAGSWLIISAANAVTLDQCLETAHETNPDGIAAEERVKAAAAAYREAASAYYPWLKSSAIYARTDNPPQAFMMSLNQRTLDMADPAFNPNEPDDTENLRLSALLQYQLLDFGRRGLDREMAQLETDAQIALRDAVRNSLGHQVTRSYFGALRAQAFVAVQEESVGVIEENLRVARERLAAGSALKTDMLNLEVQLAQAREDLIRARNGLKLSVAALNTAIGSDLVDAGHMPEEVAHLPAPPTAAAESDAEQRPEFQAAKIMTRIREAAFKKSRRAYAPAVNAFGSLDWDSDVSSDFEQSYVVGVMADLDLFDGFRRRNISAGAAASVAAARAEEVKALNDLRLDVTQASLQVAESHERIGVAGKSVESAAESLRITQERYKQGAADIADLLMAQIGLTSTRTRNVAANYEYLSALANLSRARGEFVKPPDVESKP